MRKEWGKEEGPADTGCVWVGLVLIICSLTEVTMPRSMLLKMYLRYVHKIIQFLQQKYIQ